jgi:hypothetical protein
MLLNYLLKERFIKSSTYIHPVFFFNYFELFDLIKIENA